MNAKFFIFGGVGIDPTQCHKLKPYMLKLMSDDDIFMFINYCDLVVGIGTIYK